MVTLKKHKNPTLQAGDWIKLLTFHGGNADLENHVRTSGLAKVTHIGSRDHMVDFIGHAGNVIHSNYYVNITEGRWEKLDGPPEFRPLLADIPNTKEVQEFKDKTYELVTRYASRHGYLSTVMDALKELGIDKPGGADVIATVTFTVRTKVDTIISGTTEKNFKRHFEQLSASEKASRLAQSARNGDVTVDYEVKPYEPVIVPSPSAAAAEGGS